MQKVVKFLEEYVQWIAITLGVLWIAWTGYSYWITPPDAAEINGKQVAPGDVDEEVANSQYVTDLAAAHNNQGSFPPGLQAQLAGTDPHKYVDTFMAQLSGTATGTQLVNVVNAPFPGGTPTELVRGPEGPINNTPGLIPDLKGCLVLETAKDQSAAQTGMSVVWRPDVKVPPPAQGTPEAQVYKTIPNPNPNAANPANNGNPPANVNPNANAQPANITVPPEEVTWITVSGVLDMKKLAASFQKANIPDATAITAFLRVELVRQEMQPDGTWGSEKVLDPLTNVYLPPWTPGAGPAAGAEGDYLNWAMNNTPTIITPPFYEVLRGQPWKTVHMPDQADLAAQQPVQFDPATVKPGEVWKLPDDQKKLWFKWYQDQQKQKAAQQPRPAPRTTPGSGGGAASGGGHAMLLSPSFGANIILAGDHGAADGPGAGGFNRGFAPQPMAAAGGQQPPQSSISGAFIPAQQTQDPEIWAHDETTKPGVVYRYKLRVYLKNPLFGTVNVAKNQSDTKVLAITVETDWSKPIVSPNKHEFFVINGGTTFGGVQKVGVDYFEWQNGNWKLETKTLQPGDRIGQTPWTIVDLRPVGNIEGDSRVLIINDSGQLATRFYKTDRTDPEYLRIKALIAPPAVPGSPGAPGTPTAQMTPQPGA